MAPERMVIDPRGQERLDGAEHGIKHFGFECAHDGGDLHLVVGVGCTRNLIRDNTTTGGWSFHGRPIRAGSKIDS